MTIQLSAANTNTSPLSNTRILIINPMPSTNDANAKCETRIKKYLNANPNDRNITTEIVRLNVDVPDVATNETPWAKYTTDNQAQYDMAMNRLKDGYYHGVHVLGASCDHVHFDEIKNRDLITDVFKAAEISNTGLFTICHGSFEYLNHVHHVPKGVNIAPNFIDKPSANPELLKIIGHFENKVSDEPSSDHAVQAFKDALRLTSILPTGRVGYMHDDAIQKLANEGVFEILSISPNMDARPDAQISVVYDFKRKALCMAPHIEYGPNAIQSEADRDHKNPQGRTKTPALDDIPNLHVKADYDGSAPWFQAGVALYAAWVEAINPSKAVVAPAMVVSQLPIRRDPMRDLGRMGC